MLRTEVETSRFLVFGAARSGIAAARLLKAHGAQVTVIDGKARDAAANEIAELDAANISHAWGGDISAMLTGHDVMVKSPGIPQSNPLVQQARQQGMRVISEIELAHAFMSPRARLVAITGTNGKTTTTAWIAHILKGAGYNAVPGGNIGEAWTNTVALPENQGEDTVFVIEVSSYQLEDIEHFHPYIALMTNFSPDHLDRYNDNLDEYAAAKANILRNMISGDHFILNANDEGSRRFLDACACEVAWFGREATPKGEATMGAFCIAGDISLRTRKGESIPVAPAAQLLLPGVHNLENALAAALTSYLVGASLDAIRDGLLSFRGVEHRIELCGERADQVRFYNDSKATNLNAMEQAVRAFDKPIILIAGGRDAHSDYASVRDLIASRVKHLVTLGEAAPLLEAAWGDAVSAERADSMQDAVRRAADAAVAGDVVVFSPACKSFDMYTDFEQRGRDFKLKVSELLKESI